MMSTTAAVPFDPERRERSVREKTKTSWERYTRAQRSLAGGVSSGLRRSARPYPLYFAYGSGAEVTDTDGNAYIDYGLAWGPLILGHAPPEIARAVEAQVRRGLTYGAQHDLEIEVAERLAAAIPCADLVCFANSGTEIVQLALRLARAVTGRRKFLKFEGHYHGWADSVLVSYHPTGEEIESAHGAPIGAGLGQRPHDDVLVAPWNDLEALEAVFAAAGDQISAAICEPILCNSGCILPEPGFLEKLRELCSGNGSLLIFDEVITGFRVGVAGAQGLYGITPDLATYAKAIGGGTVLSALAGRGQFMDWIATGKVVHAGSLNGNPISLAAANATLQILTRDDGAVFTAMERLGRRLRLGLEAILRKAGHTVVTQGYGPVFQLAFMKRPARNYRDTLSADKKLYSDFALALLDEGVLALPDGRWYVSAVHSERDIDATLEAAERGARHGQETLR
jgi:glutamate-1-semialdehyde 2,1-aminomutase